MKSDKWLHVISFSLLLVGGLNWGLVGVFNWNLVETLLGVWPTLVKGVYLLVGVAAVYVVATHQADCKTCAEMMPGEKKK